jgi:hypothetical protein
MNGECNQEVLEEHLLPFMGVHGCIHFLQDGVPCHVSKCIKAFLAQQTSRMIEWMSDSPDLNLLENCWNHVKNLLKKKNTLSVPKQTEATKELWTGPDE